MQAPDFIQPLLQHPVAIFGAGVSGRALTRLLSLLGTSFVVYDAAGADKALSEFTIADAETHRLVIFSPGFTPNHAWLTLAKNGGALCLGELDFAALFWRGPLIAITGTNGKTTTTEFLTHALSTAGLDATAVGNIGFPLSLLVAERSGGTHQSIAICEVSSFQAETFRYFRADSAIWTNIAEDHLERHNTLTEYFFAKWRLLERCIGGDVYVGSSVARLAAVLGQTLPAEVCICTENTPGDILLEGTIFSKFPQRENFLLVAAWWRASGYAEHILYTAARTFIAGRHRFEKVGVYNGVICWNDSKATNFHATEAALASMPQPSFLIAGGKSKGGDMGEFIKRISPRVRHLALIGETRTRLAKHCADIGLAHTVHDNMAEALQALMELAKEGDHLLLSPGFSSLDQFNNYAARGEHFTHLLDTSYGPARVTQLDPG